MNKTSFHMKGFTLELALKQRRKATRKSPIPPTCMMCHLTTTRMHCAAIFVMSDDL